MHKTLGDALSAAGFTQTIWVNKNNVAKRDVGTFNPGATAWNGLTEPGFEARYGQGSWSRKGDLVGERFAQDVVETVVRHPSNPLNIANNTVYVLTVLDKADANMVKGRSGNASVYDAFFIPQASGLSPQPQQPQQPQPQQPQPQQPQPQQPQPQQPQPQQPQPGAQNEFLSFWLGLPFGQALDIVTNNLKTGREIFKNRPVAQVADTVLKQVTMAWREIKKQG
jgi:hypothetical protein